MSLISTEVRETIGIVIGPAIFGYGVARPFRAKLGRAVLLVQSFGIPLGLAGGGATVVLLVEWLVRRLIALG